MRCLTEELDPGLFRKQGPVPEKKEARIEQFVELMRRAIGSDKVQITGNDKHETGLNGTRASEEIVASYDETAPLTEASTIPAPWYVDPRIAELERQTVFSRTWQVHGTRGPGGKAGTVCHRNSSGRAAGGRARARWMLRAFYNVCRHHAAAVVTETCGHGVNSALPVSRLELRADGSLKGMPEFDGVKNFERKDNGLVPVKVEAGRSLSLSILIRRGSLVGFSGRPGEARCAPLGLTKLHYFASQIMTSIVTGRYLSITTWMADITFRICIKD